MPGAERFHRCFLRREPAGEVRNRITPARTISNLAVGEDPPEEAIPIFRIGRCDAGDVGGVQPEPDDVHD